MSRISRANLQDAKCRVCGFQDYSTVINGGLCRHCSKFGEKDDLELVELRLEESEAKLQNIISKGWSFSTKKGLIFRCETCGSIRMMRRKSQRFCNDQCRNHRFRVEKTCPTCFEKFMPSHNSQIYCSDQCKPHFYENSRTRVCEKCGATFITPRVSQPKICRTCRRRLNRGE